MMSLNLTIQCLYDCFDDLCNVFNLRFNMSPFTSFSTILSQNKLECHNFVEKGSTSKPKGGKKKKKTHSAKKAVALTGGVKKPNGKCFHCKMLGHWKTHCPSFLDKQKNKLTSLSLVVETCLAVVSTSSWCVDSGVTDHICTGVSRSVQVK